MFVRFDFSTFLAVDKIALSEFLDGDILGPPRLPEKCGNRSSWKAEGRSYEDPYPATQTVSYLEQLLD